MIDYLMLFHEIFVEGREFVRSTPSSFSGKLLVVAESPVHYTEGAFGNTQLTSWETFST